MAHMPKYTKPQTNTHL